MEIYNHKIVKKATKIIDLSKQYFDALSGISGKTNKQVGEILDKKYGKYFEFLEPGERKNFFIKIFISYYTLQAQNSNQSNFDENKIFSQLCKKLLQFSKLKKSKNSDELEKEFESFILIPEN